MRIGRGASMFFGFALLGAVVFGAASCARTDVVGTYAQRSFGEAAKASSSRISYDRQVAAWKLDSEKGDSLFLSADFSTGKSDAVFSFDAAPFLAAGLDPNKLSGTGSAMYGIENGRLVVRFDLGDAKFAEDASASIEKTFSQIVKARRDTIGYHAQLDHYGIALGNGNMFEWAKDLAENDKDLVWVLNPAPFIAAGVDPAKVDGWLYGKVEMMDGTKKVLVDKLLKPFNLK